MNLFTALALKWTIIIVANKWAKRYLKKHPA